MSNTRTNRGGSPRIRVTGVPRKPIDVAGLAAALAELAAQIAAKKKATSSPEPKPAEASHD